MILGILIRSYKCYGNLQFIPMAFDDSNKYSVFVGNNGVGKSTVLESLDTFFNNRDWNINKTGRKDEAFIAPVFLIRKDEFLSGLSRNDDEINLLNVAKAASTRDIEEYMKDIYGINVFASMMSRFIGKAICGFSSGNYR